MAQTQDFQGNWSIRPQMILPFISPRSNRISRASLSLNQTMRELWEQHDVWTRLTIESIVFRLPDERFVISRLLRNPEDFAQALRPFYGRRIAGQFALLLTDHLVIAAELVQAAQAGDARRVAELERRWFQNARDIAAFFAKINPFWSERRWREMLFDHLRLVQTEAVQMLQGMYQASIDTYDQVEAQSLEMADEMWRGIVRQFPRRF